MTDTFKMVGEFHEKFGLTHADTVAPNFPPADVLRFRAGFMLEELAETCRAFGIAKLGEALDQLQADLKRYPDIFYVDPAAQNLEEAADGLGDLKYVVDGTAHMLGLPFNDIFAEIQRANMTKVRASDANDARSKRGHSLDVVKPAGFTPPDHGPAIARARLSR